MELPPPPSRYFYSSSMHYFVTYRTYIIPCYLVYDTRPPPMLLRNDIKTTYLNNEKWSKSLPERVGQENYFLNQIIFSQTTQYLC